MSTVLSPDAEKYRLPTDVKPTDYDVTIRTDLEQLTFDGFVKIRCVLYNPFLRV
jgi:aminopeptidase 2